MTSERNPRTVRRLGWLLLVVGLFLVGLMGTVTWRIYPSMSHPGVADLSGTTFTGTPAQAHDALQLFGIVIAFGLVSMLNGIWQIATGRRSLVFAGVTLAVGAALVFAARGFMAG